MSTDTPYDPTWYSTMEGESGGSARRVVPEVLKLVQPTSVVDFGCGIGSWPRAFMDNGVDRVVGVDDDYVDRSMLRIPAGSFIPMNLEQPETVGTFDLAVSVEVAEHLSESAADPFVATLVASAPTILFGAAVPGQGGNHHINEQWQDYWAEKFGRHGYYPDDTIRWAIWELDGVAYYYAQNTLVYSRNEVTLKAPLRIAHPGLVEALAGRTPGVRQAASDLLRSVQRSVARR